ncbi:MAG TPA: malate synthase A [Thermomicrobiales bacterium]|nr:malate synthase A [Thermomicrobiales bacterium]
MAAFSPADQKGPFTMAQGIATASVSDDLEWVLSDEALAFVADLHRTFNQRRKELLGAREDRLARILAGEEELRFLDETADVRSGEWSVAPAPADLNDRRAEITGPCDRKMVINALNSGAKVFMADLEDASSPTWHNVVDGQRNLYDAVRRTITFQNPDGRTYQLNDKVATLLVRPRGWHLHEAHITVDGEPVSGSLVDFGLYIFHNGKELIKRGSGPYFYIPKLESHLEARLWNDVFTRAQEQLGIPYGTIRATCLIETLPAAFEMEEILYELRDHAAGLNAGRWDYIFSAIKTFHNRPDKILPERSQVTMTVPFMRAYTELLVRSCHKRGAHAIGGMAAFIPTRRDPEANDRAMAAVHADKKREAGDGFDGTWVAHPGLVPVAIEEMTAVFGDAPNQKDRLREDVSVDASELTDFTVPGGTITESGVRTNVSVAIQYIASWLSGVGAAAINNLMEDAATAEISRAQLWQWIHHDQTTAEGTPITKAWYRQVLDQELGKLSGDYPFAEAVEILDELVLSDAFITFLTLPAYQRLIASEERIPSEGSA